MESPVNPQESSRILTVPKKSLPTISETSYKNFEMSSHLSFPTSRNLPLSLVGKTAIEKTIPAHSGHWIFRISTCLRSKFLFSGTKIGGKLLLSLWLPHFWKKRTKLEDKKFRLHFYCTRGIFFLTLKWSTLDIGKEVLVTSSSSQYRFGLTAWCFMPNCKTNGRIAVFLDQNHGAWGKNWGDGL